MATPVWPDLQIFSKYIRPSIWTDELAQVRPDVLTEVWPDVLSEMWPSVLT